MPNDPSSGIRLLYFYRKQCRVCVSLKPKLEEFSRNYPQFPLQMIDLEEQPHLAGQWLVFSYPAILIIQNDREMKRWVRYFSILEIEEFVTQWR